MMVEKVSSQFYLLYNKSMINIVIASTFLHFSPVGGGWEGATFFYVLSLTIILPL